MLRQIGVQVGERPSHQVGAGHQDGAGSPFERRAIPLSQPRCRERVVCLQGGGAGVAGEDGLLPHVERSGCQPAEDHHRVVGDVVQVVEGEVCLVVPGDVGEVSGTAVKPAAEHDPVGLRTNRRRHPR